MKGPAIQPVGTLVELRYKGGASWLRPFHGCEGEVLATPYGPAKRNQLVRLAGGLCVVVPAGHLRPVAYRGE